MTIPAPRRCYNQTINRRGRRTKEKSFADDTLVETTIQDSVI
ncbi:hypothetical protein ACFLXA_01620 [Chloroflexota bacterium]